jgi:hypothetical protein
MDRSNRSIRRMRLAIAVGVATVLLPLSAGCGKRDGLERIPVSGAVTFQGQPVTDGQIRFVPKPGTMAPLSIETISDGQYDTSRSGGVPVGTYRVEIRSFDPKTPAPTGPGQPQRTQLLPTKYNSGSTLELVVKSGQSSLKQDYKLNP